MDEKDKMLGIENYLKELLPGCGVENMWDPNSNKHVFRVDAPSGETKHTIGISSEFVSNNDLEDIVICLRLYNLKGYLEIFRKKEILVTDDGINTESISPSLLA